MSAVGSASALGVVGSEVTLSFMITDAYPDVTPDNIKWTFNNGQNISDITGLTTNGFSFSMDLLSLSIVGISARHEGNYTLTATNNAGSGQASIELEVEGMCKKLSTFIIADAMYEQTLSFTFFHEFVDR